MSTKIEEALINIIRSVVIDGAPDSAASAVRELSEDELKELLSLAKLHQVSHIVAYVMMNVGDERFSKPFFATAGLTAKQQFAVGEITRNFADANIPFIMLKGVVLRKLYPESWMRNSCDIDVFVKEEFLGEAEEILSKLGYEKKAGVDGLSAHDVQFEKKKVHVELHYALVAENLYPKVDQVLADVWALSISDGTSEHYMTDEAFYFYHVVHMVKHFENGGCGIRPVLDLWLLNHRTEFDQNRRDELLERGGLLKFEREISRLSELWFGDGDGEGLDDLAQFLFSGGAYGTTANSVALKKTKCGGGFCYFMKRIFAPYSLLRRYYPILNKHPFLLPIYEVKRWFDALSRDKAKYMRELRENVKSGGDEKMTAMLKSLGLKDEG